MFAVTDTPVARPAPEFYNAVSDPILVPPTSAVVSNEVRLSLPQFRGRVHNRDEAIEETIAFILVAVGPAPVRLYGTVDAIRLEVLRAARVDNPPANELNAWHQFTYPAVRFRLIMTANTAQVNVPVVTTFRNSLTAVTLLTVCRTAPIADKDPKSIRVV